MAGRGPRTGNDEAADGAGQAGDDVLVRVHDLAGRPRGTGFAADHHGTLITGHEAVAGLDRLVLRTPGGRTCTVPAEAVTPLPDLGLALVRTEGLGLAPLPVTVRDRVATGTYVRIAAGGWREARVLGASAVTYPATGRVHLLRDVLELAIGTAGADALRPGGGAAGGPVLDASTGAVVAVVGTALRPRDPGAVAPGETPPGHRAPGFAVPLRGVAGVPGPLAELLARNAATVPAYGADLNLAGVLELTATSPASAGPRSSLPPGLVERADAIREFAAFESGQAVVLGLVGPPGSGRTTELAALAARRLHGPDPSPTLWLRGADLRAEDTSVADAATRVLERAGRIVAASRRTGGASAEAVRRSADAHVLPPEGYGGELGDIGPDRLARSARAAARPLLLLLDGPEEMPAELAHRLPAWTGETATWLAETGTRLVIGCRPEYWERAGANFPAGLLHPPDGRPPTHRGGHPPTHPDDHAPPRSDGRPSPDEGGQPTRDADGCPSPDTGGCPSPNAGRSSPDARRHPSAYRGGRSSVHPGERGPQDVGRSSPPAGGQPPPHAGGPLPACVRLGDLTEEEARRVRSWAGVGEGVLVSADARHPLVLRLLSEVLAAPVDPPDESLDRDDVFAAHLDLMCLRVAVRLAAANGLPGTAVRRLATRVSGQAHEAARRCLGPGQGRLDRESFDAVFPWGAAPGRLAGVTGWASAVLTEGLLVPVGDGYRFAHEELADWLQGTHLDLEAALDSLVHRWRAAPDIGSGPPPTTAVGRRQARRRARSTVPGSGSASGSAPASGPGSDTLPVPHHRIGPVVETLLLLARQQGAAELTLRLEDLVHAVDDLLPGKRPPAGTPQGTAFGTPQGAVPAAPPGDPASILGGDLLGTPQGDRPGTSRGAAFGTARGDLPGDALGDPPPSPRVDLPGTPQGDLLGMSQGAWSGTARGDLPGGPPGASSGAQLGDPTSTPWGDGLGTSQGAVPGTPWGAVPAARPVDPASILRGDRPGTSWGAWSGTARGDLPGASLGAQLGDPADAPLDDPLWWATHLCTSTLLRVPDATPYLGVLRLLTERIVAWREQGRTVPGEFGPAFWAALPVPDAERFDLLRHLVTADPRRAPAAEPARPGEAPDVPRHLDTVSRLLAADPIAAHRPLTRWFDDERPLPATPDATVATAAQALLYAHRRRAPDDLAEALVACAHRRGDELLAVLAEEEPSAICRAVDRWARDEQPARRVAAVAYGLRAAPFARTPADRELLRHTALALLARPADGALHAGALGILVRDPLTRAPYLPQALECFAAGDPRLPPSALADAFTTHPEPVLAAFRDRLRRPGPDTAELLATLADVTTPALARRVAALVRETVELRPAAAGYLAAHVDRRLDQGSPAQAVLFPLISGLLEGCDAPVRTALARTLAAPGDTTSAPLRRELLDLLLAHERDPVVLDTVLRAVADGLDRRGEPATRELVHRVGLLLVRTPAGATGFDRGLVDMARGIPGFATLVARWLTGSPDDWSGMVGPSTRRMIENLTGVRVPA
ncbi:trypsin-like peptidase domain-containing protein [Streptomyces sp. NBC_00728]|uniref:trypsin-like peptidase domain-containing protein n=1 Tax=Streptomyces sp. NBC_00728 TaxID=2903676 RepID=UPI00386EA120